MFRGRQLMSDGDYKPALEDFMKAATAMPAEPYPYAFAATASYKRGDIDAASRYIQEAAGRDVQGDARVRILGYKALIFLKQGREREGLQALGDYIRAYEREYGPPNVREVRNVWQSGRVDIPALQQLLDEEIRVYESDIEQYRRSGTGWFAEKYGTATPVMAN
jgi:tetratricopeptide (TPR) repeat protein